MIPESVYLLIYCLATLFGLRKVLNVNTPHPLFWQVAFIIILCGLIQAVVLFLEVQS